MGEGEEGLPASRALGQSKELWKEGRPFRFDLIRFDSIRFDRTGEVDWIGLN